MLKQVKWNKNRKWSETRYAKPFNARAAMRLIVSAQIASCAAANLSAIASRQVACQTEKTDKQAASILVCAEAIRRIHAEISKGSAK